MLSKALLSSKNPLRQLQIPPKRVPKRLKELPRRLQELPRCLQEIPRSLQVTPWMPKDLHQCVQDRQKKFPRAFKTSPEYQALILEPPRIDFGSPEGEFGAPRVNFVAPRIDFGVNQVTELPSHQAIKSPSLRAPSGLGG